MTKQQKRSLFFSSLFISIFFLVFLCLILFLFFQLSSKVSRFDITYDNSGIEEFLDNLSKKIDAEKVEILGIQNSSDGINAKISIKPKGKVAQNVTLVFQNQDNEDTVSSIYIRYFARRIMQDNQTTDYAYDCNTLVADSIENYITGNSYVRERIPSYILYLQNSSAFDIDIPDPCIYSLNSGVSASISFINNASYLLIYKIEKTNQNNNNIC